MLFSERFLFKDCAELPSQSVEEKMYQYHYTKSNLHS